MDHEKILENRVELRPEEAKEVLCQECGEELIFALQDRQHQFSLGLRTVLYCLKAAEAEGCVPPLPDGWWGSIVNRHGLADIWEYPQRE